MRREEKPTRCHWMVYSTYNMLNMFRALLCPSSGARDYMCVITAYGVRCLGCWLLKVRFKAAGCIISAINHPVTYSWFFFSTHMQRRTDKHTSNRMKVFENRVLKKIFGPKRDEVTGVWRKLHNEELHDLYSSPNIIVVMKSTRMWCLRHVASMGDRGGA